MRPALPAIIILLAFTSSNAMARGPLAEPHAMFYYRFSFDGAPGRERPATFGFRMDEINYSRRHDVDYRRLMQRPAMLDLRMDRGGVKALYISGRDYLRKYRLQHADESDDTKATKDKGKSGDNAAGKDETVAEKMGSDFKKTLITVVKKTPVGVLIGVGFGLALVAGS
ncbi:MAG: hypothetical protein P8126_01400 [Gammaproteobacteria bacterium]|jgi:hypothetical protein